MRVHRWSHFICPLGVTLGLAMGAGPARAQEVIIGKDGRTQRVAVQEVSGGNLKVKVGAGTMGVPLASIARVKMEPPAGYEKALKAYQSRDFGTALAETKVLTDRFRGLPADWARQLSSMLGDIYVAIGKYADAETAYAAFEKAYPGAGSTQSSVGRARIAVAQQKWDEAKKLLEPVAAQALGQKNLADAPVIAYSQTFHLLGQVKEQAGDLNGALEDYLRTVAIFHHDPSAVDEAQKRANALRQRNTGLAVP